jgi:copper transporter 1
MLFTWNTKDLCIIFHWWHVSGPLSLAFSLLAVVLLTAAYEAIRSGSRRYEAFVNKKQEEVPRKLIPSHTQYPTSILSFILCSLLNVRGNMKLRDS